MVQLRLKGDHDDVSSMVARLRLTFDVLSVSKEYPCREGGCRVYVTVAVRRGSRG